MLQPKKVYHACYIPVDNKQRIVIYYCLRAVCHIQLVVSTNKSTILSFLFIHFFLPFLLSLSPSISSVECECCLTLFRINCHLMDFVPSLGILKTSECPCNSSLVYDVFNWVNFQLLYIATSPIHVFDHILELHLHRAILLCPCDSILCCNSCRWC